MMKTLWEEFRELAKQQAWPVYPEHRQILDAVFNLHDHFQEKELCRHPRLAAISPKKITWLLERLVQVGWIRKLFLDENKTYYEHVYGHIHHDHLVCLKCGKISEFRDEQIESRQLKVSQQHGFKMLKHSLQISGLCRECQQQPESELTYFEEVRASARERIIPLSRVANQHKVQIERVDGSASLQRRLNELGLVPGAQIEIIANQFANPFVIRVKQSRLAIGHNITHKVMVKDLGIRKS